MYFGSYILAGGSFIFFTTIAYEFACNKKSAPNSKDFYALALNALMFLATITARYFGW